MNLTLSRVLCRRSLESSAASRTLRWRLLKPALIGLFSLSAAFALWGVQLRANLWLIDDSALQRISCRGVHAIEYELALEGGIDP
jgi:hypothetical protein